MRRAAGLAAAIALTALAMAPPGAADNVTAARFEALAHAAADGSPAALSQLRAVTAIDGRAVAPATALAAATPGQLTGRLKTLTHVSAAEPALTPDAPARAATILRALGYRSPATTAPSASNSNSSSSGIGLPGPALLWFALGLAIVVLSAVVSSRVLRRLEPADRDRALPAGATSEPASSAALERDAAAAEARGAFSDAVRLRFRAGLLALARKSVIEPRPSLLDAEIARRLESSEFDELTATFERVTYGGDTATAADALEARETWPRVVAGARP